MGVGKSRFRSVSNVTGGDIMIGKDIGITDGPFADAEVVSVYTRQQAIDDGELVDMTEWGSAEKGFRGGYQCPVAFTRALWAKVDVDRLPKSRRPACQDTRGRAHDVLWMSSLALRALMRQGKDTGFFRVKMSARLLTLRVVADGDGVTIGFPECF